MATGGTRDSDGRGRSADTIGDEGDWIFGTLTGVSAGAPVVNAVPLLFFDLFIRISQRLSGMI